MATKTRLAIPSNTREHARVIGEAVDEAWHNNFGGSRIEVPLGVVAGLALVGRADPDGPDPAELAMNLDPDGFAALLLELWSRFAILRPDLLPRVKPLWKWLEDDRDEHRLKAAQAVGHAALRKGLLELTGVEWRRHDADLLGMLLQILRSKSARNGLGQFLTPVDVTDMIGEMSRVGDLGDTEGAEEAATLSEAMLAPDAKPGSRILDPCAGTGTMLLGAARSMRRRGVDPAVSEWWANDIDWAAAACCAVNMHLWGMGPRVIVGCGDGLLLDWMDEALKSRQAAIDEVTGLWEMARKFALVRELLGLPLPKSPLMRHLADAEARMPKPPPPPASHTFDAEAAYSQGRLF
ncbi:hypothetical protein Ait01nite_020210 [Actinoplanes italicus]|uniref:N-6 DNA methylase n=1 Tax=Actinoplanes italicus TaxID=113567 RepID=A0A2T0KPC2_9ACTN|nr:N-6 DNA methylase [Actinoplanes italicus]PRX25580.1 N-6 DNA methylase [Actinoplanes italicus]GIE28976.1 hypothetical protein Ait01nite_020210 [Actinoplanes italicus]